MFMNLNVKCFKPVKWNDRDTMIRKVRQAKQNAVESKLKSCAGCLFISLTHLTRASHPPAAFKHLILINTDKEHFEYRCLLLIYFNTTLELRKRALHLSINRGTRSIVTTVTVEGVHFCEPCGGSKSRRRGRGPALISPEQTRYSNNYPR